MMRNHDTFDHSSLPTTVKFRDCFKNTMLRRSCWSNNVWRWTTDVKFIKIKLKGSINSYQG